MNNDYFNISFAEKVAKVKAAPEIAVELLDNQFALIETMKTKIKVQERIIELYETKINEKIREAN